MLLLPLALLPLGLAADGGAYEPGVIRAWFSDIEAEGGSTADLLRKVMAGTAAAPGALRPDYLAQAARGLLARGGAGPWSQDEWLECANPASRADYAGFILSRPPGGCGMLGGNQLWGGGGLAVDVPQDQRREKVAAWMLQRPFFAWASPDALDRASWADLLQGQVSAEVLGGLAKTQLPAPERARLWSLLQDSSAVYAANPDERLRRLVQRTAAAAANADPSQAARLLVAGVSESLEMAGEAACGLAVAPLVRRDEPPIPTLLPEIVARCGVGGSLGAVPVRDWTLPLGEAERERLGGDPVPLPEISGPPFTAPVTVSAREWALARIGWDLAAPLLADDEAGRARLEQALARALTRSSSLE